MSPQLTHALRQAAIMVALAALGAVGLEYTNVANAANLNPVLLPVIGATVAALVRWLEGARDANRADEGRVIPSDVAYPVIADLAADPARPDVVAAGQDLYVGVPPQLQDRGVIGDEWIP